MLLNFNMNEEKKKLLLLILVRTHCRKALFSFFFIIQLGHSSNFLINVTSSRIT